MTAGKEPRTRAGRLGRALAAAGLGLAAVAAVELGFRACTAFPPGTAGTYRQDPRFLYFHAPGSAGWEISPAGEFPPVRLAYNRHGFRGEDFPEAKPPGEYRVALLGDSFVEGRQVREEETMAAVLAGLLAPPARVINAGCSAYTTTTEYLLLRHHVLACEPDLVVAVFAFNDYCDNFWYGDYAAHPEAFTAGLPASLMPAAYSPRARRERTLLAAVADSSALAAWVRRAFAPPARILPWEEVIGATEFHRSPRLVNREPAAPDELRVLEFTHRGVVEMHRLCRERGIGFVLAVLPLPPQVDAGEWREGKAAFGWGPEEVVAETRYQERLVELGRREGFPVVDLLPLFRAATRPGARLFLDRDGHLSPAGHRVAALGVRPTNRK